MLAVSVLPYNHPHRQINQFWPGLELGQPMLLARRAWGDRGAPSSPQQVSLLAALLAAFLGFVEPVSA